MHRDKIMKNFCLAPIATAILPTGTGSTCTLKLIIWVWGSYNNCYRW
jgi:hypothetical protein